jgi:hypothetical protein
VAYGGNGVEARARRPAPADAARRENHARATEEEVVRVRD